VASNRVPHRIAQAGDIRPSTAYRAFALRGIDGVSRSDPGKYRVSRCNPQPAPFWSPTVLRRYNALPTLNAKEIRPMALSRFPLMAALISLVAVSGCSSSKPDGPPVAAAPPAEPAKEAETPQPTPSPAATPPPAARPAPTPTPAPAPPPAATQPAQPSAPRQESAPPRRGQSLVLYVKAQTANLREAPDPRATKVVTTVTKGTRLTVMAKSNEWYWVKLDNGTEGWIAESAVGKSPN
jgi:hypothetical protein